MAKLLIIIIVAITISVLWFFSWYRLTDKLIEQRSPRRRVMQYLAVSTVIQVGLNIIHMYTSQHWASYYDFALMCVFILQGAIMWKLLYGWVKPSKAISSIALSYFFIYSTVYILEQMVLVNINYFIVQAGGRETEYLVVINLFVVLYHGAAMIFSLLLGKLIEKLRFASCFSNLFNIPIRGWVVCAISLLLMHSQILLPILFPVLDDSTVYLAMSLIGGAIVLFTMLALSVFETNRDKVKIQEEFIAQQQIYVQTLEGLQQDVRAFQHDYQNLLSGMYLQASQGNTEALRKTLQNKLNYFDDRLGNQIKRVTELSRIQIAAVKSLLLFKLTHAENLQVNITLEIPAEVDRVDMNMGDFVRCLGILLDNAMEAAAGINAEPVRVALIQDKSGLTVIVANPFHQKPQLHRLGEHGYTTKGTGHGTGLTSYKALTGQYDNVYVISGCLDKIFRQELQIRRQA